MGSEDDYVRISGIGSRERREETERRENAVGVVREGKQVFQFG